MGPRHQHDRCCNVSSNGGSGCLVAEFMGEKVLLCSCPIQSSPFLIVIVSIKSPSPSVITSPMTQDLCRLSYPAITTCAVHQPKGQPLSTRSKLCWHVWKLLTSVSSRFTDTTPKFPPKKRRWSHDLDQSGKICYVGTSSVWS